MFADLVAYCCFAHFNMFATTKGVEMVDQIAKVICQSGSGEDQDIDGM